MNNLELLLLELEHAFARVNEAEEELRQAKEYQQQVITSFVNALVSSD